MEKFDSPCSAGKNMPENYAGYTPQIEGDEAPYYFTHGTDYNDSACMGRNLHRPEAASHSDWFRDGDNWVRPGYAIPRDLPMPNLDDLEG